MNHSHLPMLRVMKSAAISRRFHENADTGAELVHYPPASPPAQ